MKKEIVQRLAAIAVILILAVFIFNASQILLADMYAMSPRHTLASVQDSTYQYREINWDETRRQIQLALTHDRDNPELLHLLGRAYDWQFVSVVYPDANVNAAREKALDMYRKASAIRPSWPHDRMDMLLVDYLLHGYSPGIYEQMLTVIELGPWEPWVNQVVTEIGLQQWDNLTSEARDLIAVQASRAVLDRGDYARILYLLRIYQKLELVCPGATNEKVMQYCKRFFSTDA